MASCRYRQVVQVLGDQHLGQQACRRQALVDDVRGDRRLHDPLAALAHPLAADVALDGEDAGLVVQLLGYVLADALHGLPATAGGVRGLMAHVATRQVCRQLLAPRLLPLAGGPAGLQRLNLGGHCRQVTVQRLVQQALLLGAEPLALRCELQPLEDGVLVRELLDDGLLERGLGACSPQGIAQLVGIERVEVVCNHE
jgi:hypothetical protein